MHQDFFEIIENVPVNRANTVFRMQLRGSTSHITAPGQFVEVSVPGFYLRRPISVCDVLDGVLTLIYKAVGQGTQSMTRMRRGQTLDLLTGLGNGYDPTVPRQSALLIGGGVGVPPLYGLSKALLSRGIAVTASLGFNTAAEAFYADEFTAAGCRVLLYTVDGSLGEKGFATDALSGEYDCFYACGPLPMLKTAYRNSVTSGQFSLEERMGCGFGACMGCSVRTRDGMKRVCADGPVFRKEELAWDE